MAGRAIAFIAGLLAGVALTIGVAYYMRDTLIPVIPPAPSDASRTLFVGSPGPTATAAVAPYQTIAQAMAAARPGDTIVVRPGEYREQIFVADGVTLIASPAREAIVRAPAQTLPYLPAPGGPAAIVATGGERGSRVSGFRIVSDQQGLIAVGVRAGAKTALDDLDISGTLIAAVALAGGATSLSSSVLHDNAGVALEVRGGDARVAHNVFARNASAREGAPSGSVPAPPGRPVAAPSGGAEIVLLETPRVAFVGNVITGDPAQRVRGLGVEQVARFREFNIVQPPAARPRAGTTRRTPR
jgi:hypothetical protein